MVEFLFVLSKSLIFTNLFIIANQSIIILLVNYLGNLLIFQIRNFWNFINWTIFGWDTKYRMTKCRTAGVSEFKNYDY